MAHFETDAEVYDQLGGILSNLMGNPERLGQLRQADAVVQFAFKQPNATVTLDARAGAEARIDLGASALRPDVVLAMDADTGHALLHGELNPAIALARGAVRTKGPVAKILRLVPATVGAHEVEATQPVTIGALDEGTAKETPPPAAQAAPAAAPAADEAAAAEERPAAEAPPADEAPAAEAPPAAEEEAPPAEPEAPVAGEPEAPASEGSA
jgi:putative sterol carrier protein